MPLFQLSNIIAHVRENISTCGADSQDRRWWPRDVNAVGYLHVFRQICPPYSHLDSDAQVCEVKTIH